jgi:hypothetical protein
MSYKLRLNKEKLGDFLILVLFDKLFDDTFLVDNPKFNEVFEKMESLGLKSIIFDNYFNVDPSLSSKYKQFRREFDKEGSKVSLFMFDDIQEEYDDDYREIIMECVKRITGKNNPDPNKVEEFTKQVIDDIFLLNEEDE